jgi:CheY-like chemotaxis protein
MCSSYIIASIGFSYFTDSKLIEGKLLICMTLLYADNDTEDHEIFQDVVKELDPGIEVIKAMDGIEALKILESVIILPDAVFLDLNMPLMSGIECVSILRSDVRFKATPIVIYSTTSNPLEVQKALAAGASKFLVKGNHLSQIKHDIGRALGLL